MRIDILKMIVAAGATFVLWQNFQPLEFVPHTRYINSPAIIGILAMVAVIMLITEKNSKRVIIVAIYTLLGMFAGGLLETGTNPGPFGPVMGAVIGGLIALIPRSQIRKSARALLDSELREIPGDRDQQS